MTLDSAQPTHPASGPVQGDTTAPWGLACHSSISAPQALSTPGRVQTAFPAAFYVLQESSALAKALLSLQVNRGAYSHHDSILHVPDAFHAHLTAVGTYLSLRTLQV